MKNIMDIVVVCLIIVGLFLCILGIIHLIKKKFGIGTKTVGVIIFLFVAVFLFVGRYYINDENKLNAMVEQTGENEDNEDNGKKDNNDKKDNKSNITNYDGLQTVFLSLSYETKKADLDDLIKRNSLSYSSQINNSNDAIVNYRIIADNNTSKKNIDHIDKLDVSFDKVNGKFRYADYVNAKNIKGKKILKSAVLYHHGTYDGLCDDKKKSSKNYSGYYLNDKRVPDRGIVVEYKRGVHVETNLYPCNSAKEVLKKVLEK